jgi:hypothetical protein
VLAAARLRSSDGASILICIASSAPKVAVEEHRRIDARLADACREV